MYGPLSLEETLLVPRLVMLCPVEFSFQYYWAMFEFAEGFVIGIVI